MAGENYVVLLLSFKCGLTQQRHLHELRSVCFPSTESNILSPVRSWQEGAASDIAAIPLGLNARATLLVVSRLPLGFRESSVETRQEAVASLPHPIGTPAGVWVLGPLLAAMLTFWVARRSLHQCERELRRWYDQHHGQKVMT